MVTQERPEQQEGNTAIVPAPPQQLAPVEVKEPIVPKGLTDQEVQELRARAVEVIELLEGASGSKEMELVDSITAVGIQAQRHAGTELELLRARVGDMLTGEGGGGQVTKDLVDLRLALNQINPHELSQSGFRRLLRGCTKIS